MVNDFRPFGSAMAKLSTASKIIEREGGGAVDLPLAIDKRRRIAFFGLFVWKWGQSPVDWAGVVREHTLWKASRGVRSI